MMNSCVVGSFRLLLFPPAPLSLTLSIRYLPVRPQISLGDLTPYDTETYGSDTTFYFTAGTAPTPAPKPSARFVVTEELHR